MKTCSSFVLERRGGGVDTSPAAQRRAMDDFDVLTDVRSEPPVSIRRSGGRILMAATAAGPVGGDDLRLDAVVATGARADIGSVGALIVWPGPDGGHSRSTTHVSVERNGHLSWCPEPTIAVAGSCHITEMTVDLEAGASCIVVEEIALGRSGEASGALDLIVRVTRGGRPLVHHAERFGPDVPGAGSSISVGNGGHVLTAVVVGVPAGMRLRPEVAIVDGGAAAWLPGGDDDVATLLAVAADRPGAVATARLVAPAAVPPLW
jgi:urease accessory protein